MWCDDDTVQESFFKSQQYRRAVLQRQTHLMIIYYLGIWEKPFFPPTLCGSGQIRWEVMGNNLTCPVLWTGFFWDWEHTYPVDFWSSEPNAFKFNTQSSQCVSVSYLLGWERRSSSPLPDSWGDKIRKIHLRTREMQQHNITKSTYKSAVRVNISSVNSSSFLNKEIIFYTPNCQKASNPQFCTKT